MDLKVLFPKSKVNSRTKLSEYQSRKIRRALREVEKVADGYSAMQNDFVPMKNAKAYATKQGLPKYLKGIFLKGGGRDNTKAIYDKNKHEIHYERGGSGRILRPLNNWSHRVLMGDVDRAIIELPRKGEKYLTANGRVIRNTGTTDDQSLKMNASQIFNKYKEMAERGEYRNRGQDEKTKAAHPKEWGIGILFEKPKTAAQAWRDLTPEQQAGWAEGAKYLKTTNRGAFIKVYNSQK